MQRRKMPDAERASFRSSPWIPPSFRAVSQQSLFEFSVDQCQQLMHVLLIIRRQMSTISHHHHNKMNTPSQTRISVEPARRHVEIRPEAEDPCIEPSRPSGPASISERHNIQFRHSHYPKINLISNSLHQMLPVEDSNTVQRMLHVGYSVTIGGTAGLPEPLTGHLGLLHLVIFYTNLPTTFTFPTHPLMLHMLLSQPLENGHSHTKTFTLAGKQSHNQLSQIYPKHHDLLLMH